MAAYWCANVSASDARYAAWSAPDSAGRASGGGTGAAATAVEAKLAPRLPVDERCRLTRSRRLAVARCIALEMDGIPRRVGMGRAAGARLPNAGSGSDTAELGAGYAADRGDGMTGAAELSLVGMPAALARLAVAVVGVDVGVVPDHRALDSGLPADRRASARVPCSAVPISAVITSHSSSIRSDERGVDVSGDGGRGISAALACTSRGGHAG